MLQRPDHRSRHHKRRHSVFGAVATILLLAAIVVGPYVWPVPRQQEQIAKAPQSIEHTLVVHPGPTLPAFFGDLTSTLGVTTAGPNANPSVKVITNNGGSQTPVGAPNVAPPANFSHQHIATTWFYVGEPADASNDYISNAPSAWDGNWQTHYGGVDTPTNRNGYNPSGFTPHENPFYFALPYNDIAENGTRKSTAKGCPNQGSDTYSWCKNAWIAIRHNGKIAYAQWQDVGPNNEDDYAYVFGTSAPTNTFGAHAGLDVSPAVRDYLGLSDVDTADWTFVTTSNVPAGPWATIITASPGDNTIN